MTDLNDLNTNNLITDNIDVWTSAIKKRNSQGRGSNSKVELTGVKKLRELILELAVRGKLVPQDPNDEPASVLLDKIAEEKVQLIADSKLKKQKVLPLITVEDKPHKLPKGWEFERLGNIFHIIYGKGLPNSKLTEIGFQVFGANGIIGNYSTYLYESPQLLISCRGAYSGKPNISPEKCFVTSNSLVLENSWKHIDLKYFYYSLSIADKKTIVTGSAQPQVTTTNLEPFLAIVPPLTEQHRIVAKVDELMALCDQLEQQTEQSLTAHQTLVEELLNTLTQSVNSQDFQESWQRIADHFDVLFTTEASIEQLKQTILQLAVMGKLVPQNLSDELASVLLEKIAEEKAQLIADKKIKKQKPLPVITDEEKPFELPKNWEWCRLGDLGYDLGGGTPSKAKQEYWNGNIPWISPKDMKVKYISSSQDYVTEQAINGSSAKDIPVGSLLMVVRGMILAHSFPVAITEVPVVINQDMKALVFSNVDKDFLLLMMQSIKDNVVELVDRSSHGTCKLVSDKLWSKVIPIPPLAEQHRIVAKVDELMALCDQLKTRLADAHITQLHLADAVVTNALND